MTDLIRWSSGQVAQPQKPTRLSRVEQRDQGRTLTRLENQADAQIRATQLEAEIGYAKVQAVANVGNAALAAQALISGRQQLLVNAEPAAIHSLAHISQRLTMALGDIVDSTVRDVVK